jgi:hypothetical protein
MAAPKSLEHVDEMMGGVDTDMMASGTAELPGGEVEDEGRPAVEDRTWVSDGTVTATSLKAFVDSAEAAARNIPDEQRGGGGGGKGSLRVSTVFEYCSANCNPFGERENALMATTTMLSQKGDVAGTKVPLSQVMGWCRRAAEDPAAGTLFPSKCAARTGLCVCRVSEGWLVCPAWRTFFILIFFL